MPLSKIKTTNMSEDVVILDASAADTDVGEDSSYTEHMVLQLMMDSQFYLNPIPQV